MQLKFLPLLTLYVLTSPFYNSFTLKIEIGGTVTLKVQFGGNLLPILFFFSDCYFHDFTILYVI